MKQLCLFLLAGFLLSACSAGQPAPAKTAEDYFQEGEAFLAKGLYDEAISSWEKVRDSFYSPELTMLAELKMAETYYRAERYPEAAGAYNDFLRQYPGEEKRASATYWLGMSYYRQMLAIDRDQTSTRNALAAFNDLLASFPGAYDENEIRPLIQDCRNQLAAHEVYVGRFYLRSGHYPSSIKRLEAALQNYPDYPRRDEAFFHLLSAYLKLENREQAERIFRQLQATFPDSAYSAKAQKKLAK